MSTVELNDGVHGLTDELNFLRNLYDVVHKRLLVNPLKICCSLDFLLLLFRLCCSIKGAARAAAEPGGHQCGGADGQLPWPEHGSDCV